MKAYIERDVTGGGISENDGAYRNLSQMQLAGPTLTNEECKSVNDDFGTVVDSFGSQQSIDQIRMSSNAESTTIKFGHY